MMTIYVPAPLIETYAYRHALWVLSILEYVIPDLRLILHGSDDAEGSIDRWVKGIITSDSAVSLVPTSVSVDKLLAEADMIWLPQQCDGLPQCMEQIKAAGKPILASQVPALVEELRNHSRITFLSVKEPSLWAKVIFQHLGLTSTKRQAA
jgi:glycosyltransferase involved in cell wall biosynthesis